MCVSSTFQRSRYISTGWRCHSAGGAIRQPFHYVLEFLLIRTNRVQGHVNHALIHLAHPTLRVGFRWAGVAAGAHCRVTMPLGLAE